MSQSQVGAEFLALHYPLKLIYIPSPTWANHNKIFPLAGIEIRNYRYYKPSTRGLDYEVSVSCCQPLSCQTSMQPAYTAQMLHRKSFVASCQNMLYHACFTLLLRVMCRMWPCSMTGLMGRYCKAI